MNHIIQHSSLCATTLYAMCARSCLDRTTSSGNSSHMIDDPGQRALGSCCCNRSSQTEQNV